MPSVPASSAPLRWLLAASRVLLVTFLLALLAFAVCLFSGIVGVLLSAAVRGVHPNMTLAYRAIALPAAAVAAAAALVTAIVLEARYRSRQPDDLRSM